jgi:HAD superfamily hydrolase (TIGR01450 family)
MQDKLKKVKHVFLDMDGTIYHGGVLFPTTRPFLAFLERLGIGHTFLSNNSSYGHLEYMQRLANFGIEARADEFYISTDYAIDYMRRHHPDWRRLFVLGMPCMVKMLEEAGFESVEENPQAVVVGFDRGLVYERLCRCAWFLRQGVPGLATHPDVFCPTDAPTWLVDCGAITACLETATNTRLQVLGKPDPGMLREASARLGLDVTETLMVGDRLSTDMSLGINAGAVTCHIVTPGADLVPPQGVHPDYAVANLGELQREWEAELAMLDGNLTGDK